MKKILYVLLLFLMMISNVLAEEINLIRDKIDNTALYYLDKSQNRYRFLQAEKYFFGENIAYCIDLGAKITSNIYYPTESLEDSNLSDDIIDKVKLLAYYGYSYPEHNTDKFYMATQELIWNAIEKYKMSWVENFAVSADIDISREKAEIMNLVNTHYLKPSFDGKTIEYIKGTKLEIEDKNNILSRYETNNQNVTISGNKLIIDEGFKGDEIFLTKSLNKNKSFLLYKNGNSQKMISPGEIKNITSKLNVKLKTGSIEVIKRDGENNNFLDNAVYYIYDDKDNYVDKIVTGVKNKIENLPFGVYTLVEKKAPEGYKLDEHKYVYFINKENYNIKQFLYNYKIKRKIELFKVFSNNKNGELIGEPNIKFDIYKDNNLYNSIITDEKGHTSIILPYGKYTFKQVNTTENYEKVKDFIVNIYEENDKPIYKLLSDKKITSKIKIIKKDIDTHKNILDSRIKFKIYDVNNKKYLKLYLPSSNKEVEEFEVDKNGIFITPTALEPGKYAIEEVRNSNYPYLYNNEKIEFTIDENSNFVNINNENYLEFNYYNKMVKGDIYVKKLGEIPLYKDNCIIYDKIPLKDIEFSLYAKENLYENGVLIYKKDSLIMKKSTDKEGNIIFENLPLGKYYLKETSNLIKYEINDKIYNIELKYKDDITKKVNSKIVVENKLKKGILIVNKYEKGSNLKISDTLIEVRNEKNNLIYKGYTDKNGQIKLDNIPYGKYYLSELEASTGYRLLEDNVYFEIKDNNTNIDVYNERIKIPNTGLNITYINLIFLILFIITLIISIIFLKNKIIIFISILSILGTILLIGINIYNYYKCNIYNKKFVTDFIEEQKEDNKETYENDKEKLKIDERYDYKYLLEIPAINLKRGILDINNKYNKAKYNIELVQNKDDLVILAAHNGKNYNSFFGDLHKLELGDNIKYHDGKILNEYIVEDIYDIKKDGYASIYKRKNTKAIALITCKDNDDNAQIVYLCYKI